MPLQISTLTILAGQSLSNGVNCSKGRCVLIEFPDQWNAANMTFQVSSDGVTWRDYFYITPGTFMPMEVREVMMPVLAKVATIVTGPQWADVLWIKIRSGTTARPIVQSADRKFVLTIDMAAAVIS